MLGKLMKYEFKATSRTFLPMFGALIVVSLVNRIFDGLGLGAPKIIGIVISFILMAAICVATLLITLQRFNRNLLQNEGYLTMTLPVKTESVILSKLFVSSIWYIASFVIVMIAILLLPITGITWADVARFLEMVFAGLSAQAALVAFEGIVALILSMFASTLLIYACMTLGMLASNRRGLLAFVAFLVISTAIQVLGSIAIAIGYATDIGVLFAGWSGLALIHLTLIGTSVISLAGCAIFFWLTRHMLKYRLNLQ